MLDDGYVPLAGDPALTDFPKATLAAFDQALNPMPKAPQTVGAFRGHGWWSQRQF